MLVYLVLLAFLPPVGVTAVVDAIAFVPTVAGFPAVVYVSLRITVCDPDLHWFDSNIFFTNVSIF